MPHAAPATVIYVSNTHPDAGDNQPGTQARPLVSINAALQRAWPGDTVLVGSGTYRERLAFVRGGASPEMPLTLKALTPHTVQILGSEVVTQWVPAFDQIWVHHNWSSTSRQVFQNGRPLMPVGSMRGSPSPGGLHEMVSGSFWYDTALGDLYVWLPDGSSPRQHLMEVAVHPRLIAATDVDYIHLEGLVFAHSSVDPGDPESAMITVQGRHWTIDNCRFLYADAGALSLIGDGHVLTSNVFFWSGAYGIQIQSAGETSQSQLSLEASLPLARVVLDGNETSYGNTVHTGLQEMSGAVQAENFCGHLLITRHLAVSNAGAGLRIGTECREVVVQQSLFRRNSAGLVATGGRRLAVTNSIFADNMLAMSLFGAGEARVQLNTFHQNVYGLLLGDKGLAPSLPEWHTGRAPAAYNLFHRNLELDLGLWALPGPSRFPIADANIYAHADIDARYQWMDPDGQLHRTNRQSEFQDATGQERQSRIIAPLWDPSSAALDFMPPPTFPLIPAVSQDHVLADVDFYGSPRHPHELAAGAVVPARDTPSPSVATGWPSRPSPQNFRVADADSETGVPDESAPSDPLKASAQAATTTTASFAPDLQSGGFFQTESGTLATHLAWWAGEPFTDLQGTLWIGVDGAGPDAIKAVQFAIDGAWQPPVTQPHYHADRDLTAWWLAVPFRIPPSDLTINARVIFGDGAVHLYSNRLTIGHNRQGWNGLTFAGGWVVLAPAPDSRLIYLAADGDDTLAEAVYGRGWYEPHDPEIGPDPTRPVGPIVAYASVAAAAQKLRLTNWMGVQGGVDQYGDRAAYQQHQDTLGHEWLGYPDWLLYRRGDDFRGQPQPDTEALRPRAQGLRQRGRAANMPMVITAWGDPAASRPLLATWEMWGHARHFRLVSLDITGQIHWKSGAQSQQHNAWWAEDILLEDVRARGLGSTNHGAWDGVLVRRSAVVDQWDANRHNQGIYINNTEFAGQPLAQGPPGLIWPADRWRFEGTLFDRNGYKQDPNEPATWTRDVNGRDDLPSGRGVQPRRTWYDRNIYAATYGQLHLVNNLFSRNGGGGSVQMRAGGIADNNLFLWNESALSTSHAQTDRDRTQDAVIRNNVVLHDDHWLPPGGFGQGLYLGVGPQRTGVMIGNIVAHLHRGNNGGAALAVGGIPEYRRPAQDGWLPPQPAGYVTVMHNLGFTRQTDNLLIQGPSEPDGILAGQIGGNILVNLDSRRVARFNHPSPSPEVQFGAGSTTGNHYLASGSAGFAVASDQIIDFEQWQATGLDHHSVLYAELASLADAMNWRPPGANQGAVAGWERDMVYCLQAIDPFYIPDEEVYVDAGARGAKQAERQKVWEVLTRFDGYPHDGPRPRLSEADARSVARRYHAFLTFMERARENRKHQWNAQYTAEALKACIREGFGDPGSPFAF